MQTKENFWKSDNGCMVSKVGNFSGQGFQSFTVTQITYLVNNNNSWELNICYDSDSRNKLLIETNLESAA